MACNMLNNRKWIAAGQPPAEKSIYDYLYYHTFFPYEEHFVNIFIIIPKFPDYNMRLDKRYRRCKYAATIITGLLYGFQLSALTNFIKICATWALVAVP